MGARAVGGVVLSGRALSTAAKPEPDGIPTASVFEAGALSETTAAMGSSSGEAASLVAGREAGGGETSAARLRPPWFFLAARVVVAHCFLPQVGFIEAGAGVPEMLSPAFMICIPPARAKAHVSAKDASRGFTRPMVGML